MDPDVVAQLEEHVTIISSSLDTIEACGGGSARCMMAEVFLPKEDQLLKVLEFKRKIIFKFVYIQNRLVTIH